MKKILYMALAAIAALSSCSSEDIADNSSNNNNNGDAKVFTGTIENDNSVTRSTYNSETKKANWESTDKISINGAVYTVDPFADPAKADFYHQSGTEPTAPYYAFFADGANTGTGSYSADGKFTLPASYNYAAGKFNMPMYAYSASSTELSFKNLCGVLAITVPSDNMSTVSTITVYSDKQLNGAFTATAAGVLTFESKTLTDADKKITLNVATGGSGNVYYIPVPAGDHNFVVVVSDGTTAKSMATSSAVTIARNKIYNISFNASNILPAKFKFSVSGSKTVQFTKGNLYWNKSESTYHLEATQYASPNSTSGNSDTYSDDHVAHFFYSKTETISRAKTYSDASAATSDVFWCNVDNKIKVDETSGLYVLTNDEWSYLIGEATSSRSTTLRKYNVEVAGKPCCLVIAPDNFSGTIADSYSAEDWAIAEATCGLVCLPAAGFWNGASFYVGGSYGYYWSATPISGCACGLYFDSGNVGASLINSRIDGCSVRLVK